MKFRPCARATGVIFPCAGCWITRNYRLTRVTTLRCCQMGGAGGCAGRALADRRTGTIIVTPQGREVNLVGQV